MHPDYWLEVESRGDKWFAPISAGSEGFARDVARGRLNAATAPYWTAARLMTRKGQDVCKWRRAPVAID
jgi:hypothetical protein